MTGTLDALTNLELQCLGLWILLRTSSGRNDRDSGILLLTSSGNDCSNMRGSRGGTRGQDPLWKITSYMRFYGNKHLDPPPWKCWTSPPEKCWTPMYNCKISWGFKKNVVAVVFRQSGLPPPLTPFDKDSWIRASQRNSNRISEALKLCARKCRDNIEGHLQTFSDSYISQLWYYRFFFYPTDIPSPHIGWHFANSLSW